MKGVVWKETTVHEPVDASQVAEAASVSKATQALICMFICFFNLSFHPILLSENCSQPARNFSVQRPRSSEVMQFLENANSGCIDREDRKAAMPSGARQTTAAAHGSNAALDKPPPPANSEPSPQHQSRCFCYSFVKHSCSVRFFERSQ